MDPITRLSQVDFMAHLNEQDLVALAGICQRRRVVAGEELIKQGDLTHSFFIIDEGHIHFRWTDGEGFEHPSGSKGPGEYFGKQMFSAQEPAELTAEALGQAVLYVIAREPFDQVCAVMPDLLKHMPEVVAARRNLTQGFHWLTEGEVVAHTYYRHPLAVVRALLFPLALVVLAAVVKVATGLVSFQLSDTVVLGVIGLIVVVALVWALLSILDWSDDKLVVTNKRVVDFERQVYTTEMRNQIPIPHIQSITIRKTGIIESALDVGTIEIQSAGMKDSHIVFERVGNPDAIKTTIQKQQGLVRARHQAEDRERFRRRVGGELRHYVLQQPVQETLTIPRPVARRGIRGRLGRFWADMFAYEIRRGETVTWRKHWYGLFQHTRGWLLLALGLLLGLVIYLLIFPHLLTTVQFFAIFGVLAVVDISGLAYEWADWRNDIYLLTERAIVDIERKPLGLKSSSKEALLVNVQDVKSERPHLLNALLNFGDVEIRVAGGGEPMVFYNVAHPEQISNEIFRRLEGFRIKQREREASLQSRNIVDALVAYHRLVVQERHSNGLNAAAESIPPSLEAGPLPPSALPAPETGTGTSSAPTSQEPPSLPPRTGGLSEFPVIQDSD